MRVKKRMKIYVGSGGGSGGSTAIKKVSGGSLKKAISGVKKVAPITKKPMQTSVRSRGGGVKTALKSATAGGAVGAGVGAVGCTG